ncbi:pentapeptide repeat-containing protein [Geomonas sp. Red32]|uniref:pentapeptide repeat-containing protein n=1 Tax=Geomonas sp. Red32 TaxID=2912856 RepID=UPI00202CD7EF|nr:pentapeptide repeat-containing protein [Geomonas sp. Red32]MCM0080985.1 pentapeptide repeat-containing protein [Geomonas sp. Red32]
MKRSFARIVTPVILGLSLAIPAWPAPPAPGPATGKDEAAALKEAELKLAALAREAETPPAKAKKPAKKKVHAKKKRSAKAHKGDASGAAVKVVKVTDRRLTSAEVQGILATTRDLSGTDLSGLSLVGMDLSGVRFNRANLKQANLERADLADTDLELADLSGANLKGASLNQARLRGTRLVGTRMEGALWIDRTVCRPGSVGSCIE